MLIYPSELAGKIEYDESGTLVPTCEEGGDPIISELSVKQ